MGHYSDEIEARRIGHVEATAKMLGRTYEQHVTICEHNRKMSEGQALFSEDSRKKEAIKYYLDNKD
jgi:hypothetical protein